MAPGWSPEGLNGETTWKSAIEGGYREGVSGQLLTAPAASTQCAMASGRCRADEPLDTAWQAPREAPVIIGAMWTGAGPCHTQAPWTTSGAVPSTAVRNPEA